MAVAEGWENLVRVFSAGGHKRLSAVCVASSLFLVGASILVAGSSSVSCSVCISAEELTTADEMHFGQTV